MESAWLAQDEDHGLCKASSKLLVIQLCQCLWLTLSSKFRLTCENISEVLFVAMVSTWLKSMLCCASCSVSKQFAIPKQGNDVELLKDRRRAVQSMTFSVWVWCILMYHMGHIYLAQWSCRPCMKRKKPEHALQWQLLVTVSQWVSFVMCTILGPNICTAWWNLCYYLPQESACQVLQALQWLSNVKASGSSSSYIICKLGMTRHQSMLWSLTVLSHCLVPVGWNKHDAMSGQQLPLTIYEKHSM